MFNTERVRHDKLLPRRSPDEAVIMAKDLEISLLKLRIELLNIRVAVANVR